MLRRRARRLPILIAALVLAGGIAVAVLHHGTTTVTLAVARIGPAVEAVYATGNVEPEFWARIGPVSTGRIAEVLVKEGDSVTIGQPLARLDDREARARVAELEARAAYWRGEVARSRTLTERGIRSKEASDKAQSEYQQVQAAIQAARQRRLDLVVTSPIDGVVLRRDGEPGEVVEPKDALFWIGEPRPLRITADVDEEDIARVSPGQRVLIKADAFSDRILDGTVDRMTPKGDPVQKAFRVRVRLPDDTPLLVGMTAEINIVTAEKAAALLVPAGAAAGATLMVVEDGRAQPRNVRFGIRGRDAVEVVEGLAAGATVVVNPPSTLKPGDRVAAGP